MKDLAKAVHDLFAIGGSALVFGPRVDLAESEDIVRRALATKPLVVVQDSDELSWEELSASILEKKHAVLITTHGRISSAARQLLRALLNAKDRGQMTAPLLVCSSSSSLPVSEELHAKLAPLIWRLA